MRHTAAALCVLQSALAVTLSPSLRQPPQANVAPNLLSLHPDAAAPIIGGTGSAKLVWELLRRGEDPFGEAGAEQLPATTHRALKSSFAPPTYTVGAEASVSACGTRKLLLAMAAGG